MPRLLADGRALGTGPMIVRSTTGGVVILAPAKLNLFLEILGRRADGYHDLESLMLTVDLYDTLTFADEPSGRITLRCDDPSLPTGSENLVVRAAEALRESSGCGLGASIVLSKAIPAQAGLAGGSSDAAATLTGLDLLWDLRTPPGQLDALAGSIGSDVSFFRHGPSAVCRGRGEVVEPHPLPGPLALVLVCPPVRSRHSRSLPPAHPAREASADRAVPGGARRRRHPDDRGRHVQSAPADRRSPVPGPGEGPGRLGLRQPRARRAPDERQRLGLLRPGPGSRRGSPRRGPNRNARTRTSPGRDQPSLSRERLAS